MFKLKEAPLDFFEEYNSTEGGSSLNDSFVPAHQTICEGITIGGVGDDSKYPWGNIEDGCNFVWEDRVEEYGLPVSKNYDGSNMERMEVMKRFVDWSFQEEVQEEV